jgi:hypothetical protein
LGIFFNNKENKKNDNEPPKKVKRNPSYLVFDWNIDVHVVTVNWSINQPEEKWKTSSTNILNSTRAPELLRQVLNTLLPPAQIN